MYPSFSRSYALSMESPSRLNFPQDLVLRIYKLCPTFSTASALSRTSHTCREIWTANLPSICSAILPRTIECHDQASVLFEAQEKAAPLKQSMNRRLITVLKTARAALPEVIFLLQEPQETGLAIERVRRFMSNANAMYTALDRFDITAAPKNQMRTLDFREMTSTERVSFIKAYYRVTAMATMAEQRSLCDLFAPLDMLDIAQMWDILNWMVKYDGPQPILKVAPNPTAQERFSPVSISASNWKTAYARMYDLIQDLQDQPRVTFLTHRASEIIYRSQHIVEHESDQTEGGRGSRISDILPFLDPGIFEI